MRLPAYRASYLGRYHPYPRTRVPARETVVVCTVYRTYAYHGTLTASPICLQAESEPLEGKAVENVNTVGDLSIVIQTRGYLRYVPREAPKFDKAMTMYSNVKAFFHRLSEKPGSMVQHQLPMVVYTFDY